MDFSRLPDTAFLKIAEYLSFEDCIRVSRVSKAFRRISQLATSRTKCLDLTKGRLEYLNEHQLGVILDLCSTNLEKIAFFQDSTTDQLPAALANYQCPRLTDIDLGLSSIDFGIFDRLIRNNPQLESLAWWEKFVGFPDVVNNNLKKLDLIVDEAGLNSLIGRCPNLKDLRMSTENITNNVFDLFFASIPHVQQIDLYVHKDIDDDEDEPMVDIERLEDLANIWNLPLISLSLHLSQGEYPGDGFLQKVASSFPHLKTFGMYMHATNATNQGVAALAALKELEILELDLHNGHEYYDQGIRQLVSCKQLRKLLLWTKISGGTLIALLRGCPKLEKIEIRKINQVDTPEKAAVIFESLSGITKRDITIGFGFHSNSCGKRSFDAKWDTEPVKKAIRSLEENEDIKIKISWDDPFGGYGY